MKLRCSSYIRCLVSFYDTNIRLGKVSGCVYNLTQEMFGAGMSIVIMKGAGLWAVFIERFGMLGRP